jgi:hypothetical protein
MGAMKLLPALIAALLLTVLPVLSACGGDDDDDDDDGDAGPAATIRVNSAGDSAEPDGELTLREAMMLAVGLAALDALSEEERGQVEGMPGAESADLITFDSSLEDEVTIELESGLPVLSTGDDTVQGRPASGEAPRPVIDGSTAEFRCFEISSSNNALLGLELTGCRTALLIGQAAEQNRIGGPGPGQGNVISGNTVGIELSGRDNKIQGNFIGTDRTGTEELGNEFEGIWITPLGRENTIGGPGEGEGNVISGNPLFGISIDGAGSNVIQGNIIGLDVTAASAIANRYGINVQAGAKDNLIGGDSAEEGNTIAGNEAGILFRGVGTTGNTVRHNTFQVFDIRNSANVFEEPDATGNVIEDNDPAE